MTDTTLLHPGDPFPELTVALPGGRNLQLPGGRVVISVYSSSAIGRLVPQDVIGLVRYLREHGPGRPDGPGRPVSHAPAG